MCERDKCVRDVPVCVGVTSVSARYQCVWELPVCLRDVISLISLSDRLFAIKKGERLFYIRCMWGNILLVCQGNVCCR